MQLGVLSLGFLQDGDVSVGVFPESEEILVSGGGSDLLKDSCVGEFTRKLLPRPEPAFSVKRWLWFATRMPNPLTPENERGSIRRNRLQIPGEHLPYKKAQCADCCSGFSGKRLAKTWLKPPSCSCWSA